MRILIAIQARSTSQRLPGKSLMHLEDKPILNMVVNECLRSSQYLSGPKTGDSCSVAILTPYDDEISKRKWNCEVIQGDENDVLSRFVTAAFQVDADFIVRITADCPMIISTVISKCCNVATKNNLDFVTNAHPEYRTSIDGLDVEVMSRKALAWLHNNALTATDREHVTKKLYDGKIPELKYGFILNDFDLSHIKLSIDTKQEYESMVEEINKVGRKKTALWYRYGENSVYRFSG
jgi:spore coat polysaccharide biosynthesis protein SpsF (cytidylyltransferase family)